MAWGDAPVELASGFKNTASLTCTGTVTQAGRAGALMLLRSAATNSGAADVGAAVASVSDTRNGSWTGAQIASGARTSTWFADIVMFVAPAALQVGDVITVTYGVSADDHSFVVEEIDGQASPFFDVTNSHGSTGTVTIDCAALPSAGTLGQSQELVYVAWCLGDDTSSTDGGVGTTMVAGPGGYTRLRSLGSGDGAGTASGVTFGEYLYVSSSAQVSPTGTTGAARNFAGVGVTIKANLVSPPSNSVVPAVSGTAQAGSALATTNGTWINNPTSFTYQWQRDTAGNGTFVDIVGATSQAYTLAVGDVGNNVRCVVTALNSAGSAAANSNAKGGGLMKVAADGVTVTAPAVGIVASGEILIRKLGEATFTDHPTQTVNLSGDVAVGESVLACTVYSTFTNWAAGYSDGTGNVYAAHVLVSSTPNGSMSVDVWGSLNVPNALPSGTPLVHTAAGSSGAGGGGTPSDSIRIEIYAITPPQGKAFSAGTSATGGGNTATPPMTTGSSSTAAPALLLGVFGTTAKVAPFFDAGAGGWQEIADYGDATDPTKQIGVEARGVSAPGSYNATGGLTAGGTVSYSSVFVPYAVVVPAAQTAAQMLVPSVRVVGLH